MKKVLIIQKDNFIISIGSKDVPIKDKFTLINGKIKKNLLNKYKNNLYLEISENLNKIPIEKYIGFLQEGSGEFHELQKSRRLINFIHEYRKIVSSNILLFSQYNEVVDNLILILRYNMLLKKKESLLKELELTKQYKKSSEITASTDLVKKLNESLTINKKKLKFLEEDYFQRKNQVDQIKKTISEYNSKIQELTKQKKQYFSQINKITREMTGDTPEPKKELNNNITESGTKITNAEKIKNFQKKAKEIQFEITKIKSKKSQTQFKLEELTVVFEIYKKDYQELVELINNEEKRIIDLQSELKNIIKDEGNTFVQDLDLIDLKSFKPSQEIKDDLKKTETELNKIILPKDFNTPQNPNDLSPITKKLKELDEKIKNQESKIMITINEKDILESFEEFRRLENNLYEIESLVNKFLSEINIKSQLRIIVNDDNKYFFIEITFIRNDKEKVNFDGLTTPEKIFFIMAFYISIKLNIKIENIIFSNVSILSIYDKAGSIYRTIRKILPIFEMEDKLSRFNLIFIISNLELKREIKNLKIYTIQES